MRLCAWNNSRIIVRPIRNLHRRPFDQGTRDKLELCREYLREWLPVFITDWNLAKHYGLTDEELDFIINYDTCQPAGRSSTAWGGRWTAVPETARLFAEKYRDR
jgi:hypothetical protein